MNDEANKARILEYLKGFSSDRRAWWICKELNLKYHTVYTLCLELEKEGYVLVGGKLTNEISAMLSEQGNHLMDKGGYKKRPKDLSYVKRNYVLAILAILAPIILYLIGLRCNR